MTNFKSEIADALAPITGLTKELLEGAITLPQHPTHGDFSFPCFPLAKTLRKAPLVIAQELAQKVTLPLGFLKAEALGGYLNFFVNKSEFAKRVLFSVLTEGPNFGNGNLGISKKVVIDFSSPNMGKELAFHHLRGTMIGHSLSKIFKKTGFEVIRINHLGDWGTSYGKLIVMYLRAGFTETDLTQLSLPKLNALYRDFDAALKLDTALDEEARRAFTRLESGDSQYRTLWSAFREVTLLELRRLYSILGVGFDSYTGEAFFADRMKHSVNLLRSVGLLKESQGAEVVDLSEFNMPPALIRKSDGSTLYITRDLAAANYRHSEYQFDHCFYVVDNGQSLHFQQLFKVLEMMQYQWVAACEHIPFGLVLIKNEAGTWEKGKTRSGQSNLLKDVLEAAQEKILEIMAEKNPTAVKNESLAMQIAVGALVFSELKNRRLNDIRFEWDQALSFEGDSGPYVQNAHVRMCSILKKAGLKSKMWSTEDLNGIRWELYSDSGSQGLLDLLAQFHDKVTLAMTNRDPCPMAQYVLSIADETHRYLHHTRVLETPEARERLLLVYAVKSVMALALDLIGVPAIESM